MIALLESPWPILFIGIGVEAVLAVFLLRTGRGWALWAMLGVGLLTLTGLGLERLVLTDREAVEDTLDACAAAVEANDLDRLLGHISPTAPKTQDDARFVLSRVDVRKARINNLEIKVNRLTSPPTAKAKFRALGTGRDRKGEFPYRGYTTKVVVNLRREGDHWRIADYTIEDPHLP